MNCLFCKIINKEIPNYTVYEDESVLAFLDIFPHAKGHCVVIPKKHYERLADLNEEEWKNISAGLANSVKKLQDKLAPAGFNIAINDGKVAGQVVPHVHWHIFPRYSGDGGGSAHSIIKNDGGVRAEEIYEKLK